MSFNKIYESFKEAIYKYKNRFVIATNHFYEQISKRNKLTQQQVNIIFERGIDKLIEIGDKAGEYLIYSKEFNQGLVVGWRRQGNPKLDDGKNHFIIITFLPLGRSNPKPGTSKQIVEQIDMYYSDQLIEYFNSVFNFNSNINKIEYNIMEKTYNNYNFEFTFVEGKYWELNNYNVIEVQ